MTRDKPIRNVPPPQGSKGGTPYTRFIPREELGEVESWKPGAFGGAGPSAAGGPAAEAGPEPSPEELRERLAAERQALRQAAYQEGYRDGLAALENFKQHFAAQATAQIGQLLGAFDRQLGEMDNRIADTVARTAVQLAQQVVRQELTTHPGLVARVAADAVQAVMMSARHIAVHAHPADLPLIAEGAEEALAARGARLVADETVARGGVRVESDAGQVDARIATRWAQAVAALGSDQPWPADTTDFPA
jgi:flagellar assembly protein FliH